MGIRIRRIIFFLIIWGVYLFLQSKSIYGGDAGDLATAAYVWGVPHPSGYALYTLLGGILVHLLPFYTVAWRVGLLSSFFAALSVIIFYDLLKIITGKDILSLVGSLLLAFLYPFWLYAEVDEVFSMAVFFLLVLLWLAIKYRESGEVKYIYWLLFTLGLSLTHHQIIIFLFPSLILLFWPARRKIWRQLRNNAVWKAVALFLAGLTPLIYLPIAASFYPPIDWEHPTNLSGFLNEIFRTAYGTFKSGPYVSDIPQVRIFSFLGFYHLFLIDLKPIGIIFLILGLVQFYRKRKYFWAILTGFLSFSFFLFYADFPLSDAFSIATYERFTIFPYLFCIIFIIFGIDLFGVFFLNLIKHSVKAEKQNLLFKLISGVFIIYPLSLFGLNYPVISSLKNDFTAERFARDLLKSVPKNSLLLLINDTAIFDTQYVYYTEHFESKLNLVPIHLYKLLRPYYLASLKRSYPNISIPDLNGLTQQNFITKFIYLNAAKYSVTTNFSLEEIKDHLSPRGLIWQYFSTKDPLSLTEVVNLNRKYWQEYQKLSPDNIIFRNLFLVDILSNYGIARENYANYLINNNLGNEALISLKEAQRLVPNDADIYFLEGNAYKDVNDCVSSEKAYNSYKIFYPQNQLVYQALIDLSKNCYHDNNRETGYENELKDVLNAAKPKLNNL